MTLAKLYTDLLCTGTSESIHHEVPHVEVGVARLALRTLVKNLLPGS